MWYEKSWFISEKEYQKSKRFEKLIKLKERLTKNKTMFKVGDKVICISNKRKGGSTVDELELHKTYEVVEVYKHSNINSFYKLSSIPNNFFHTSLFISVLENRKIKK